MPLLADVLQDPSLQAVYAIARELGLVPAITIVLCYLHHQISNRPILVTGLGLLRALVGVAKLSREELAAALTAAEAEVPNVAIPMGIVEQLRRAFGRTAVVIAFVALGILAAGGCVQFVHVHQSPKTEVRAHQDTARVTSSTQEGNASAEVPVSVIPK